MTGPAGAAAPVPVSPSPAARRITARELDVPRCALGESPRYAHGAWWWVDAERGTVFGAGPDVVRGGPARAVLDLGGRVSLVQPATGGRIVVAHGPRLLVTDRSGAAARPWADVELPAGGLLNDGIADERGRLWVGTVGPHRRPAGGAVLVVGEDGALAPAAAGRTLSNGMAWVASARLWHADSLQRCLVEYSVDLERGRVVRVREVITFAQRPEHALPDGLAADADGAVWVAMYGTGQVWRIVDGRIDTVIEVSTAQVTSICLGGPDGRDALVTTAGEGMDAAALAADPAAGRIFHCRVDVPGRPVPLVRPDP